MVSALTFKLINCDGIFYANTLFPALSNFKNMSKTHIEIKEFSKIILSKVENCVTDRWFPNDEFFIPGLNVLEGLGLKHAEVNELKLFLFVFLIFISSSSEVFLRSERIFLSTPGTFFNTS